MFERQSELVRVLAARGRDGAQGKRALRIGEVRGFEILQVAAFADSLEAMERTVRSVIGVDLPRQAGFAVHTDERSLLKVGPEQFWIVSPESGGLLAGLRLQLPSSVASITSLSHARTRILIEGSTARELLGKAIALDLHPDVFRLHSFALTGLHHTPVLLHRTGEERYELYAMRTFAVWVWDWLTDAAWPLGYEVV